MKSLLDSVDIAEERWLQLLKKILVNSVQFVSSF